MWFDVQNVITHLLHMGIAYLLAFPIGWNRERSARSAGLRTFPLVAVGACSFMLVGLDVLETDDARARVVYGIITGIGFIGGGAIIRERGGVTGTATAASIWNTGAIGVAVAWGRMEIAVLLSFLNFITLYYLAPLKERLSDECISDPDPPDKKH